MTAIDSGRMSTASGAPGEAALGTTASPLTPREQVLRAQVERAPSAAWEAAVRELRRMGLSDGQAWAHADVIRMEVERVLLERGQVVARLAGSAS